MGDKWEDALTSEGEVSRTMLVATFVMTLILVGVIFILLQVPVMCILFVKVGWGPPSFSGYILMLEIPMFVLSVLAGIRIWEHEMSRLKSGKAKKVDGGREGAH